MEVRRLLATPLAIRYSPLWESVSAYNQQHRPGTTYKVTFYCGQYVGEEQER